MTDRAQRYGTVGGAPITEELMERLADEAEAGFSPEQIRGPGRPRLSPGQGPSAIVQVRVDDALQRRLADRAVEDGTSVSAVVREALRLHLG
jgi:hypothetical protein